ncbi:MAG: class I tRNA ligase family protein [Phycisphaerales bacterium]
MGPYYVTTPIYYVNDRPHIGHCYTTLIADVAARAQRLIRGQALPHTSPDDASKDVFLLTGTDEHAEKVVASAREHGMSPMEWATLNADRFREAFAFMNFSNDDFVRTTEDRHKDKASAYIKRLLDQGDIELGDYEGWFDASQEEYLTETVAKENDYKSPVTGKPLEKRTEQNYFFRLDKYEGWLKAQIESGAIRVLPEQRKNEVMGRINQGLQKVPVSRRIKPGDEDWGIKMPADPDHRIYVWIEALCNYLTTMDTDVRRRFWPPLERGGAGSPPLREAGAEPQIVHLMAKDILWFHAVIWPAMLHALGERPPSVVYAHAYWIAEGKKMSKSLGNFIEIDTLRAYADRYSLDAVRWYLTTQGPLGATDADFAYQRFVEVYNADLANGIGNATSRVANMIEKYFEGMLPDPHDTVGFGSFTGPPPPGGESKTLKLSDMEPIYSRTYAEDYPDDSPEFDMRDNATGLVRQSLEALELLRLDQALQQGKLLASFVDLYVGVSRPFSIAKDLDGERVVKQLDNRTTLAAILYHCAEALRIASLLLSPAMPEKMAELWRNWNCNHLNNPNDPNSGFVAPLEKLAEWGGDYSLKPGQKISKGDALFMRADVKDPAPGS